MSTKHNKSPSALLDLMPQGTLAQQILSQRAELLKKPALDKDELEQLRHYVNYVRFKLGDQGHFGIPYSYVKEVMLNIKATQVPHSPPYIAGVINRYGALISILDLNAFFHLQATEAKQSHLLVVNAGMMTLAILAHTIEGSASYDKSSLDAPLGTEDALKPKYVLGLHQGLTTILNIEALLMDLQAQTRPIKEST